MKVIAPSPLIREAAEVLSPFVDDVVVVGAAALEVALATTPATASATRDLDLVVVTPTRDVDAVVPVSMARDIVAHLEAHELSRSEIEHERAFTWVRGDLKVQLVRTFHPFPRPPADGLPANPVFGMATKPVHQVIVAFAGSPTVPRLTCANGACVLALKEAAFGRTRAGEDGVVERDYHDAFLLMTAGSAAVLGELNEAESEVRRRVERAATLLAGDGEETAAAGRQMFRMDQAASQRLAEAAVRRGAARFAQELQKQTSRERPKQ